MTDSWYLGALYLRYKVLKGIKDDTQENKGQFQSSFKEFEGKIIKDWLWELSEWKMVLKCNFV